MTPTAEQNTTTNDKIAELVSDYFNTYSVMSSEDWDNLLLQVGI